MKLVEASDRHFHALMKWFDDESSLKAWGGPLFRYPFSKGSFREDLKLGETQSYALIGDSQQMIGFGQTYLNFGRGHLARLAVSPEHRTRGYGLVLVRRMMQKATELFACSEYSLYVLPENMAARRCYEKAGFRESISPDKDNLYKNVRFMVRRKDGAT